ncbi:MAG: hypothetical protein FWF10_11760 [Clostridiales bacterium]|nr:hypothetical protein [Clostridiales bacterium]
MSKVSDKISYLEGLLDGLDLQDEKTAKMLRGILDALREIADELEDLEEDIEDVEDQVEDIWDAIEEMEDEEDFDPRAFLANMEWHDDEDWDEDEEDEDEDDEFDAEDFLELTCEHCGNTIYFDESMVDLPEGLICPNCNEGITIEIQCGECE